MYRPVLLSLLVCASAARAKPWQGIEPGVSTRDEVVRRFGEPSRVLKAEGKEVLAYLAKEAIRGTTQAQFKLDPASRRVERIDVFPGPVIDRETIENSYGPACPPGPAPATPCYLKKLTDDFRTYYLYPRLGLAIFFNEDGKTVHSFVFTTQKAAR